MTEPAARRRRLSRGALRALAWIVGGAAFAAPFASLTVSPRPATAESARAVKPRRVVVVRKITRLVVVRQPETPGVQYVYVNGGSSNASNSGPSGAGTTAAAAPPASTTTSGGS